MGWDGRETVKQGGIFTPTHPFTNALGIEMCYYGWDGGRYHASMDGKRRSPGDWVGGGRDELVCLLRDSSIYMYHQMAMNPTYS